MSQEGREDLDLGSGLVSELWGQQAVWGRALLSSGVGGEWRADAFIRRQQAMAMMAKAYELEVRVKGWAEVAL